jgi:hypothetical protein
MACPGCGVNTTDPECWSCGRFLGGKGIVRLSDRRFQFTTGRRVFYFRYRDADEADMRVLNLERSYYYECTDAEVRAISITHMVNILGNL